MITFKLNGTQVEANVPADMPLLWVIRDHFKMKGSKFGCGMGLCGACSMMLDGMSTRTCILPVSAVANKSITTIEGLSAGEQLSQLQQAWVDDSVPQCGYCQSGQLISATALLKQNANPSDAQIDQAMSGNICRCGTYPRIKQAIKKVANNRQASVEIFDPALNQTHNTVEEANV